MKRRTISFIAVLVSLALGIGLILYGNTMPKNIDMFSRYSGSFTGTTNLVMLVGEIMTLVAAVCLIWWILERTKRPRRGLSDENKNLEDKAKTNRLL